MIGIFQTIMFNIITVLIAQNMKKYALYCSFLITQHITENSILMFKFDDKTKKRRNVF